jgi:hypothetical protein
VEVEVRRGVVVVDFTVTPTPYLHHHPYATFSLKWAPYYSYGS